MKPAPHVLYLDFDGVLHPEGVYWHPKRGAYLHADYTNAGHALFEHAPLLEELLAPYPDVAIVLSTSWAVQYRYERAAKRLTESLRTRCIGATYHTAMERQTFANLPRGHQVRADVVRRQPAIWLAIDDTDEGWDRAREHVVITDPVHGIAKPAVLERMRQALMRFRRR
jgi:hypothetical protein